MLEALLEQYKPFKSTSESWGECLGSDPKKRGYPCALWQTFHSITVGSRILDPLKKNKDVSKTIVDYVLNFFVCTDCVENFKEEVAKTNNGSLPSMPSDTMFWLWQLHNMANLRLKGMEKLEAIYIIIIEL